MLQIFKLDIIFCVFLCLSRSRESSSTLPQQCLGKPSLSMCHQSYLPCPRAEEEVGQLVPTGKILMSRVIKLVRNCNADFLISGKIQSHWKLSWVHCCWCFLLSCTSPVNSSLRWLRTSSKTTTAYSDVSFYFHFIFLYVTFTMT